MPDISMCPSWQCPSRATCRRNEASGTQPSMRQSWMGFDEKRGLADRCDHYWPTGRLALAQAQRAAKDGGGDP